MKILKKNFWFLKIILEMKLKDHVFIFLEWFLKIKLREKIKIKLRMKEFFFGILNYRKNKIIGTLFRFLNFGNKLNEKHVIII